jgi:hypothetical protein
LLLAGVVLLLYADPLARVSLGVSSSTFSFTSVTRTFTTGTRTVTFSPGSGNFTAGSFPAGGFAGRSVNTNGTIETLVAIGLVGVGLVLEVMTIFLWQGQQKPATPAAAG